jgi:hypothetical protein
VTKLKEKRREIIIHLAKTYGIEIDGAYIISVWELADMINNTWASMYFIKNPKRFKRKNSNGEKFSIPNYDLPTLFRGIRHALRGDILPLDLKTCESNRVEYVVMTAPHSPQEGK